MWLTLRPVRRQPLSFLWALAAISLALGMFAGLRAVGTETGRLALDSQNALTGRGDYELRCSNVDRAQVNALQALPDITAVVRTRTGFAELRGSTTSTVRLYGLVFVLEAMAKRFRFGDVEGDPRAMPRRSNESPDAPARIAISHNLAARLGVSLGDAIRVRVDDQGREARVGLLFAGQGLLGAVEDSIALVDFEVAQSWLPEGRGLDEVTLFVDPNADGDGLDQRVREGLRSIVGDAPRVRSLANRGEKIRGALGVFRRTWDLIALLVFGLSVVAIGATIGARHRARRREDQELERLGAPSTVLLGRRVVEPLLIAVLGSMCAAPLGQAFAESLAPAIQGLTEWFGAEIPGGTATSPRIEANSSLELLPFALLATVVGSTWPGWLDRVRGGRLRPLTTIAIASALWVVLSAAMHWSAGRPAIRAINAMAATLFALGLGPTLVAVIARTLRSTRSSHLALATISARRLPSRTLARTATVAATTAFLLLLAGFRQTFEDASESAQTGPGLYVETDSAEVDSIQALGLRSVEPDPQDPTRGVLRFVEETDLQRASESIRDSVADGLLVARLDRLESEFGRASLAARKLLDRALWPAIALGTLVILAMFRATRALRPRRPEGLEWREDAFVATASALAGAFVAEVVRYVWTTYTVRDVFDTELPWTPELVLGPLAAVITGVAVAALTRTATLGANAPPSIR